MAMGTWSMLLLGAMLVLIEFRFLAFELLAEILVRTYHESQNKSVPTVREVIRTAPPKIATPEEINSRADPARCSRIERLRFLKC